MKANTLLALLLLGCFGYVDAQFIKSYWSHPGPADASRRDDYGNVYLAIDASGDSLGGIAYPNGTFSGFGIAKFDPHGVFQWASMASSPGNFSVVNMDVDGGGNVVFAALVFDSIQWGGFSYQTMPVVGAHDEMVIGLIDSTGTLQWLHGLHTFTHWGDDISFLPSGDIAWCMGYRGAASFNGYALPPSGSFNGSLLVLDRNAVVQSAYQLNAAGHAWITDVEPGPNQDIWFTGSFSGNSATLLGTTIQGNGSAQTTFMGRISANGNLQWVTAFQQGHGAVDGLAVDDVGNCFFAGSIYEPASLGGVALACSTGGAEMLAGRLYPNGVLAWVVASRSPSNLSFLMAVDYHPDHGLLCWGIAQQGTGDFAGMPFSAGQFRNYFAVLDSMGVGITSMTLDTTIWAWGREQGQWADSGNIFFAGVYPQSGGNLLGQVLPTPPTPWGSFAANISTNGNRIKGHVYADLDQNGAFGAGDVQMAYHPVTTAAGLAVLTGPQGRFDFAVGPGAHAMSTASPSPLYQVLPPSATVSFTGLDLVDSSTVFRLVPTSLIPDLRLDLVAPPTAQPGLPHQLHLLATNIGTQAASGTLTLDLDPDVAFLSAHPAPDTVQGTHLAWNTGPISPFGQHSVSVLVEADTLLTIGDTLAYHAALHGPALDFDLENQNEHAQVVIVTSFDPNDKAVSPAVATPTYLQDGGKLRYVVRFQNTGNAPAHRVLIRDTLASQLDLTGFRFVGSSHPVDVRLYDDHILHLVFDPISLPDSATDPLLSQGYAVFELPTATGLVSGDRIGNRVGIYFDYNAPVLTNTAVFQVLEPVTGATDPRASLSVVLYPNPGAEVLHIRDLTPKMFPLEVSVVDVQGRVLTRKGFRAPQGELSLSVAELPAGVYVVRVATADGRVEAFRWVGR